MTNTKKGVANYATSKANPGPKTSAADKAGDGAEKSAPVSDQPAEEHPAPETGKVYFDPLPSPDAPETPVEQTQAYAVGREAKRHGINRLDAPFPDGDDKDAWLKGYDFEPDQI